MRFFGTGDKVVDARNIAGNPFETDRATHIATVVALPQHEHGLYTIRYEDGTELHAAGYDLTPACRACGGVVSRWTARGIPGLPDGDGIVCNECGEEQ